MKILAFDIATSTGVAYGSAGGTPRSTTVRLRDAASGPDRFAKMIEATRKLVGDLRPDLVVYEAPIGGATADPMPAMLAACCAGQARSMGVRVEGCSLASIRKHFLGKNLTSRDFPGLTKPQARTAIKRAVIGRCLSLGWDVETDDEADACALWDYACATFARAQTVPPGLFTGAR